MEKTIYTKLCSGGVVKERARISDKISDVINEKNKIHDNRQNCKFERP